MDDIRIILTDRLDELEKHENKWNELMRKCPGLAPTQTFAWVHGLFLYKIKENTQWVCLFAYKNQDLVGVLPLVRNKRSGLPGLYFQLYQSPYDYYHPVRTDGVILPDYEFVMKLFIDKIKQTYKVNPVLQLRFVPDSSSAYKYLADSKNKAYSLLIFSRNEDIIYLPNGKDEYFNSLDSKFLRELKRRVKRLSETYEVKYTFNENIMTNRQCLDIFTELEDMGWKGKGKITTIKKIPRDFDLFLNSTNKLLKQGWVQWNFLEADKHIIAAQLISTINGVAYVWKVAYDEKYSKYAPGNLLMQKFIENSYKEETIQEFNFLNERDSFKVWNVKTRRIYELFIFPGKGILSFLLKKYFTLKNRHKIFVEIANQK